MVNLKNSKNCFHNPTCVWATVCESYTSSVSYHDLHASLDIPSSYAQLAIDMSRGDFSNTWIGLWELFESVSK